MKNVILAILVILSSSCVQAQYSPPPTRVNYGVQYNEYVPRGYPNILQYNNPPVYYSYPVYPNTIRSRNYYPSYPRYNYNRYPQYNHYYRSGYYPRVQPRSIRPDYHYRPNPPQNQRPIYNPFR